MYIFAILYTCAKIPKEGCLLESPIAIHYIPDEVNNFQPAHEPVYMLTVAPGLESVAAAEAACKLAVSVRAMMRGKVFVSAVEPPAYERLRCSDNVYEYLYVGDIGTTRVALAGFKTALATVPFRRVIEKLCHSAAPGFSFTVNASITGKHTYSRFEAAAAFSSALEESYRLSPGTHESRDIEFRLDIIGERFLLFTKLTDAAFRFRGAARQFTAAALRPTVAAALVWVSQPHDGDVFADPFCGSGTILCERAAYPCKQLIGADHSEAAIAQTRCNIEALGEKNTDIRLLTVDINTLSLTCCSVDTVVTNPPWGGQIETDDPLALYTVWLRRCDAFLKKDGQIIALTPLADELTRAAEVCSFSVEKLFTVSLHGRLCYICRLRRLSITKGCGK